MSVEPIGGAELKNDLRELTGKVQRVSDELEIRNLLARIYLMSDQEPDLEVYGLNFTEDAVWERVDGKGTGHHTSSRLDGRAEILADRKEVRRVNAIGPTSRRRLLLTTIVVEIGDDDTANASSKYLVVNGANRPPVIDAVGLYEDTLRRTEAGWKLCHRRYSALSVND